MEIPKTWTFKSDHIAENFNQHVLEQLPWYNLATDAVVHVVRHYLPQHGLAYDVGASTGNIGRAINPVLIEREASLIAVEESEEMANRYQGPGTVIRKAAQDVCFQPFDVAILFLVMMFMSVAERRTLLVSLRRQMKTGGVIIIFDKVVAPSGYFGTVLRRLTMDWKLKQGTSADDIVAKELSLSGVQRPIMPIILGLDAICFFTFGEFAGWIIESPEK